MKKLKKLFAVMLSLVMVLAMGMTSFAADNKNTITISGKGLDAEGAGASYGQIIKEAARDSYRLPDVLVEAADLPAPIIYIGDLPEKKIYKIIANYYGGEAK